LAKKTQNSSSVAQSKLLLESTIHNEPDVEGKSPKYKLKRKNQHRDKEGNRIQNKIQKSYGYSRSMVDSQMNIESSNDERSIDKSDKAKSPLTKTSKSPVKTGKKIGNSSIENLQSGKRMKKVKTEKIDAAFKAKKKEDNAKNRSQDTVRTKVKNQRKRKKGQLLKTFTKLKIHLIIVQKIERNTRSLTKF